ncbi:hypothetical protein [Arthrobacter sp. UYCu723]
MTTSIDGTELSFPVAPSLSGLFTDRKVLFTKSKDNELEWIRDWAIFHVLNQKIDAILIYDNGSTKYEPEDVLDCLKGIEGLEVAVVVHWPFPFGPQGGSWDGLRNAPWDSDYCEYGIIQHARHRFLKDSYGVIQADVDELVMSDDGRTVFEILEGSAAPVIGYSGRWIEATGADQSQVYRFGDFRYFDLRRPPTSPKWSALTKGIAEAKQWKTHYVQGAVVEKTDSVVHRHFVGISSSWKFDRTKENAFDSKYFVVDELLVDLLESQRSKFGEGIETAPMIAEQPPTRSSDYYALQGIQKDIHASGLLPQPVAREWYHTVSTLVFDYKWNGKNFAFDITKKQGELTIQFLGRDQASESLVARTVSAAGIASTLSPQQKHIVLELREPFVGAGAEVAKRMALLVNAGHEAGIVLSPDRPIHEATEFPS